MENKFEYYKENYYRELNIKSEINNSLSLPIGIISGIIAGMFYLFSNFDFRYAGLLNAIFILFLSLDFIFLIISIYYLIKAYSDFPKGYEYALLPDTNEIDLYETQLKTYYSDNKILDKSKDDVKEYILSQMIMNTGQN